MKTKRKIIEINEELCNGCGQCVMDCAEGALQIVDGKAKIVSEVFCDGLGACIGGCPQGALKIVERESLPFDEEAVKKHLEAQKAKQPPTMACGCPSSQIRQFSTQPTSSTTPTSGGYDELPSCLSHWPVQIRLVPTSAPFLKGSSLLIAADCAPVAYRNFHGDFLKGRTVMIGCPKFDDIEGYYQKFVELFSEGGIKDITVLSMEVPCCSKLPHAVKKALEASKKDIPFKEVVVSVKGNILPAR